MLSIQSNMVVFVGQEKECKRFLLYNVVNSIKHGNICWTRKRNKLMYTAGDLMSLYLFLHYIGLRDED